MPLTKSQKQIIILGALLAAIGGVLAFTLFRSATTFEEAYQPKTIQTAVPRGVLTNPEYAKLTSPVKLPLEVGKTGRENPFDKY